MLEVARIIDAPAPAAWQLLVDTTSWPRWSVTLHAVASADRRLQLGSRGYVRTLGGLWLPFVVTQFEPGRAWSWRVGYLASIGHRVVPLAEARCRVIFELPWLAWPYAPVCRVALRRIASALATST